ncbi:MAG TPA: hypothetical protein VNP92_14885 [Actinophytocola sp.]|nr:hypothetical protein [Actinophytocola sp.]
MTAGLVAGRPLSVIAAWSPLSGAGTANAWPPRNSRRQPEPTRRRTATGDQKSGRC